MTVSAMFKEFSINAIKDYYRFYNSDTQYYTSHKKQRGKPVIHSRVRDHYKPPLLISLVVIGHAQFQSLSISGIYKTLPLPPNRTFNHQVILSLHAAELRNKSSHYKQFIRDSKRLATGNQSVKAPKGIPINQEIQKQSASAVKVYSLDMSLCKTYWIYRGGNKF